MLDINHSRDEAEVAAERSTLNPNVCLSIREIVLDEVSRDIMEEAPVVKSLSSRLRRDLCLYEMRKQASFVRVSGADAGSQVLPLASKRYAVISALVYSLPSGSSFYERPEMLVFPYTLANDRFVGEVNLRREAKLFETASKFIETRTDAQLLLIDGPLAFSNLWRLNGRRGEHGRLTTAVNRLLSLCQERGTMVAGIVKRASARYLVYHLGLQDETVLPDAFLLLQTLRPGERTEVFSPRAALRKATRAMAFMDAIRFPIYSFYARFTRDWSIPPIRIDVPAFSLGRLDEIASHCYDSSLLDGIPLPLVRADEEVRISRRFMSELYSETLGRVGRLSGDLSHLAPYWGEGGWLRVYP